MSSLRSTIPWPAKVAAKMVLSRIPVGYRFWRHLSLFQHGAMQSPAYAFDVFKTHFERAGFSQSRIPSVIMELGPGDSLLSAVIARAFGASATFLVDTAPFADCDFRVYQSMGEYLRARGFSLPCAVREARTTEALLAACNARYLTEGLSSLRTIPSGSVDLTWSQAVLEHVRKEDFLPTMLELSRILRPTGVSSHRIDLKDHLGNSLNHLRFSERLWESPLMARSGFYTNRLRCSEMTALFLSAGFEVQVLKRERWDRLPVARSRLHAEFRALSDEELCTSAFDVILTRACARQ